MIRSAALLLLLSGCATLSNPTGFASCKAADVLTTIAVVERGGVEKNPLFADATNRKNYAPMILSGVLMYAVLKWVNNPDVTGAASGITCASAALNTRNF